MILDAELYLRRREKNPLTRYRLLRRTEKTIEVIKKYKVGENNLQYRNFNNFDTGKGVGKKLPHVLGVTANEVSARGGEAPMDKIATKSHILSLLDIGAADGAMLSVLRKQFGFKRAIGVEPNMDLIRAKKDSQIELINSTGESLPFSEGEFDVVLLSAVIEHVSNPEKVISESYRVLSPGGLLVVITVVNWMDKMAEKLKIFPSSLHKHFYRFNLKELKELLENKGFEILELGKFALPTSGFLLIEFKIEKFLSRLGIDFLMTYELAVAKKII